VAIEAINADGCSNDGIAAITVAQASQPFVTMSPSTGLICPNDSVMLVSTGSGNFAWQGPSGPIGGNSSTIYAHQAGTYYCIVTNAYNCSLISNSVLITQYNSPYLIAVPDTLFCPGDSVTIEIICNPIDTISWNAPFSGSSLSKIIHIAGTYSCNLTGCNQTVTATIHISMANPIASFSSDTLSGCLDFKAHFINTSTNANSYKWYFGDNTTDTAKNPFHIYTSTGLFTVSLVAYLNGQCHDSTAQANYINVLANPVTIAYTAIPLTGCNPLTVTFDNTSNDALTYQWYFGDHDSSSLMNPTHTYTIPGIYSDTLIITNSTVCGGVIDTLIRHNYITVKASVIAAFTADTLHGCLPFIVQFTNSSSNATSYHWNFGDLDTSNSINPIHTFDSAGIFNITLIAYNTDGCNDTSTIPAYIHVLTILMPISSFIANPLSGCDSITVQFTNNSSNGTSYLWRFGDGTTDTLPNPIHHYDSTGSYTITLITYSTNICGSLVDSTVQTNYITVYKSAHASFIADTLTGCIPFTVNFTNNSTFATGFNWAFGNNNSSILMNPNNTYDSTGVYSVTLIADGAGGCNDTAHYSYISVIKLPKVTSAFVADTTYGCTPLTVIFTNSSSNGMTYLWNFGDPNNNQDTSTNTNPTYTFKDTGEFTITLISINDTSICGLVMDTLIKKDYIALANPENVTGNFSGSPVSGCVPLIVNFTDSSTNGTSYYWNFGNGQSSIAKNPAGIIYLDSGIYTITHIAYNINARCYNPPDTATLEIIAKPCTLTFPNVFSPNGDGKNDLLNFIADGYSNYHLILFDRWGLKIFESNNAAYLWNGKVNNTDGDCPDGTYYYIFTADDGFGNPFSNHGFISLIR
jgi:gliding motility-associated-like protein